MRKHITTEWASISPYAYNPYIRLIYSVYNIKVSDAINKGNDPLISLKCNVLNSDRIEKNAKKNTAVFQTTLYFAPQVTIPRGPYELRHVEDGCYSKEFI